MMRLMESHLSDLFGNEMFFFPVDSWELFNQCVCLDLDLRADFQIT